MRQMLGNRRLVNEPATDPQYAGDLSQRCDRTGAATADVVARSEIDYEIELAIGEGQRAHVGLDDGGANARASNALARQADERRIDVDARQRRRTQPRREHGQRHTTATADLEHSLAYRRTQRAKKKRYFEPFLQTVPRFYIAECSIAVRVWPNANEWTALGRRTVAGRFRRESLSHTGACGVGSWHGTLIMNATNTIGTDQDRLAGPMAFAWPRMTH
jgi:hypothetical protein